MVALGLAACKALHIVHIAFRWHVRMFTFLQLKQHHAHSYADQLLPAMSSNSSNSTHTEPFALHCFQLLLFLATLIHSPTGAIKQCRQRTRFHHTIWGHLLCGVHCPAVIPAAAACGACLLKRVTSPVNLVHGLLWYSVIVCTCLFQDSSSIANFP